MSVTGYEQTRIGNVVLVTVTTDLSGTVYYHWYLDGLYVGCTLEPSREFHLNPDEQARIEVLDTTDPAFDPVQNAPAAFPARRHLWWVRSLETDVDHYRVEQKKGSGSWETVGVVYHDPTRWHYALLSDRLDDLADYTWRVIPVDEAGNDGSPKTIDPERIVRTPDAPDYTISFDPGTTRVTFAEAA